MELLNKHEIQTHNTVLSKFVKKAKKVILRDYQLFLLCLPAIIYCIIFEYGPMYGIQIAFKDFSAAKGIMESPWVGFKHFDRFFQSYQFWLLIRNTIGISLYALIAGFPIPIFVALLLNQTRNLAFKKIVQTTTYAPHFISVVVLCGMITIFLSPRSGLVNHLIAALGGERVFFLADPRLFSSLFVWSDIWQNTGWGTIIYTAALSAINPELYEAARIDGANKLKTIIHVDIPGILPTVVILFILKMGSLMNLGFQKAYLLQNPLNAGASEIIATYVYKIGLEQSQFSYSTAISLFNTAINIIMLVAVNALCKKVSETSLW